MLMKWAESFQFVVMGNHFSLRGNWIPADTFPSRLTRDDYTRLLTAVRDANMIMLRVWGGESMRMTSLRYL